MGRQCGRCQGAPEVFDEYFGSKYKAEILAVGGEHPILPHRDTHDKSEDSSSVSC